MKTTLKSKLVCLTLCGALFCSIAPANAQNLTVQKPKTEASSSSFLKIKPLIKTFSEAISAKKAFTVLDQIKENLRDELAQAKKSVVQQKEAGNDEAAVAALKLNEKLGVIYNRLIEFGRSAEKLNKEEVMKALNDYQKLH